MPPKDDDHRLVTAALDGDHEAFAQLYDRYAGLVRALAFDETANIADAQELAQETFVRAYEKLATLRDPARFAPWLIGIARRVIGEWRRRRARNTTRFDAIAPEDLPDPRTAEEYAHDDLQHAMAQLPPADRLVIHWFYLQQHPVDRARELLGLSRSGFYKRLDRAKRRLKRILARSESPLP